MLSDGGGRAVADLVWGRTAPEVVWEAPPARKHTSLPEVEDAAIRGQVAGTLHGNDVDWSDGIERERMGFCAASRPDLNPC